MFILKQTEQRGNFALPWLPGLPGELKIGAECPVKGCEGQGRRHGEMSKRMFAIYVNGTLVEGGFFSRRAAENCRDHQHPRGVVRRQP